ncbi:MAG: ABC transporter permease [Epsilonproteobacteria bacterium]|nr:MAG: ABC transporter permease [Campylobacterota bacterium]
MYKLSLWLLFGLVLLVFVLPYFYVLSPYELHSSKILLSPSIHNIFGTDRLGRDIFARVLQGGQVSLIIGFVSATISIFVGLIVGITAGYFKGYIDKITTIVIDLFLTFPTFFLLLAIISYIDASIVVLIIVLSVTGWMGTGRLIRSLSYEITDKPYIDILKVAKVNRFKILFKYYTPLISPILLVSWTFGVAGAILAESSLSFLGLGINPPQMSWGSLISEGRAILDIAWWVSFFPGFFIFIVTFCLFQILDKFQQNIQK